MSAPHLTVDDFRRSLEPEALATVDALRGLVRKAQPEAEEHIKWNAPSFVFRGEDRITLGLDKTGHVRVVLHRGAKAKSVAGFTFAAPTDLVKWPAADRGVMMFSNAGEVSLRADEIGDLFGRWLEIQ